MKQIVDKLNKIAKKIDESVEIPQTDLIIDSLDAITKAYGGTPNDSNLIVDKLDDIYNNVSSAPSGNIEITENGENINVAPYATATVNVAGGGGNNPFKKTVITMPNTTELDISVPSSIKLKGYCFDAYELSNHMAPNYVIAPENLELQLNLVIPTIPANTTVILNAYYCSTSPDAPSSAIELNESYGVDITNMRYNTNAYEVTNVSIDSAITIEIK